jgi:hypothetical protein
VGPGFKSQPAHQNFFWKLAIFAARIGAAFFVFTHYVFPKITGDPRIERMRPKTPRQGFFNKFFGLSKKLLGPEFPELGSKHP